jgi:uncharacterized membrane protein YhhN
VSLYIWLITIALMGILMQICFNQRDYYKNQARALTAKAACTFITVLVCLYGMIETGASGATWILFAGICICVAADVIIGIHFVAGMLVFLCAHLCFIAYFLTLAPLKGLSIVLFALLYAGIVKGFWKFLPALGKRLVPFTVYPAVLIIMFSIAMLLPFSLGSVGSVFLAVGAGLFAVSDVILAGNTLGDYSKTKDRAVLYLYYPAVYFLAVSVFYM